MYANPTTSESYDHMFAKATLPGYIWLFQRHSISQFICRNRPKRRTLENLNTANEVVLLWCEGLKQHQFPAAMAVLDPESSMKRRPMPR
jgi:hypothetical protein